MRGEGRGARDEGRGARGEGEGVRGEGRGARGEGRGSQEGRLLGICRGTPCGCPTLDYGHFVPKTDLSAPTGRRIPAQGATLGRRGTPLRRSEGTPHRVDRQPVRLLGICGLPGLRPLQSVLWQPSPPFDTKTRDVPIPVATICQVCLIIRLPVTFRTWPVPAHPAPPVPLAAACAPVHRKMDRNRINSHCASANEGWKFR